LDEYEILEEKTGPFLAWFLLWLWWPQCHLYCSIKNCLHILQKNKHRSPVH